MSLFSNRCDGKDFFDCCILLEKYFETSVSKKLSLSFNKQWANFERYLVKGKTIIYLVYILVTQRQRECLTLIS